MSVPGDGGVTVSVPGDGGVTVSVPGDGGVLESPYSVTVTVASAVSVAPSSSVIS